MNQQKASMNQWDALMYHWNRGVECADAPAGFVDERNGWTGDRYDEDKLWIYTLF